MTLSIVKPGFFTTVQDLGRRGFQSRGISVSGPMDRFSLRIGNAMLGNGENAAAFEITVIGPEAVFEDDRCVVLTGSDSGMEINGQSAKAWTVYRVRPGDRIKAGTLSEGCRSYLCVSGGADVPPVMGSRSTFTRAGIGGYKGRQLASGDRVALCGNPPLWQRSEGFVCPPELKPAFGREAPVLAMDGPQSDAFAERGIGTFYGEIYTVTNESDRMGYRLDGPAIELKSGADIISDGIVHGAVQVPGDGRPIVMMADCQTTGGYAKIATVCAWSAAALAHRLPGDEVRFARISEGRATELLREFEKNLTKLTERRATYRSRPGGRT
jgi:biotin-dependent carboxylase-like uncharacterized protein